MIALARVRSHRAADSLRLSRADVADARRYLELHRSRLRHFRH
jgi:hypothetical protein